MEERERQKLAECRAGEDLHMELLPDNHPLKHAFLPLEDHPRKHEIRANDSLGGDNNAVS